MRIVAGTHRGRPLVAPEGDIVRPTGDRARQALFNILAHGKLSAASGPVYAGARVLDAFAGTGALGLEALSRGASHAVFIEDDRIALQALRRNIAALGEEGRTRVIATDALRPPRADAPCTLAFLDPPYHQGLAGAALAALAKAGWLAPGALCSVETAAKEELEAPEGFELLDDRRYGKARLRIFRAP